jgi:hypothetical protein
MIFVIKSLKCPYYLTNKCQMTKMIGAREINYFYVVHGERSLFLIS